MQKDSYGVRTRQMDYLFDNREILGLRGRDKLLLIVKLQAQFRGFLTRKRVKETYNF